MGLHLPRELMNGWWIAALLVNVTLLTRGRWTAATQLGAAAVAPL